MPLYIYELVCPLKNIPRYVGKTDNLQRRLEEHIKKAKLGLTTHHCARWINTLLAEGLTPIIRPIQELDETAPWQDAEKFWIASYREMGYPLTNLTSGGDGFSGLSQDALERRTQSRRKTLEQNPEIIEGMRASMIAAWADPQRRKVSSDRLKSLWEEGGAYDRMIAAMNTPEAKRKRSEATLKRFEDPVELAKHAARMAEIWGTPERREEQRQRALVSHADPDVKAKRIQSLKLAYQDPVTKAKNAAQRQALLDDPEMQLRRLKAAREALQSAEMSAKLKQAWTNPELLQGQADRLKARWQDPEAKAKMHDARWTDEKKAKQAANLEARRAKMLEAMTPEARAKQAEKMKAKWADPEFRAKVAATKAAKKAAKQSDSVYPSGDPESTRPERA